MKPHFKVPEGVKRVSNRADGGLEGVLDIGKSVRGKGANGEMDGKQLPHYT